ncbi:MAG: F0F1 ATP synthase subunit delta [Zetaproteobacteria bacterium]|nr:MAG: F0F1 ATP synthase subunit delta [Zetaproteobacteria bacterium]
MSTQFISRRYARALFDLLKEGVDLRDGLHALAQVVKADDEVRAFLASPAVPAARKLAALSKAVADLSGELERLVQLLAERNKLVLLPEIAELLDELIRQSQAEAVADVMVAAPLSKDVQKKIAQALSKRIGKKVSLRVHEDPSILGGLVIRLGDRQLDYSLRTRLEGLRRAIAG